MRREDLEIWPSSYTLPLLGRGEEFILEAVRTNFVLEVVRTRV